MEELLSIRGIKVDHSTIQRWVFKFSPMIEANMHRRKRKVNNFGGWMKPILRLVVKIVPFIEL